MNNHFHEKSGFNVSLYGSASLNKQFERVATRHAVRPSDLDSMGHVNNAKVLEYLEHGRWAWLAHHRIASNKRITPIITRIEVDYRREIFWGELAIYTAIAEKTFYKVILNQSIDASVNGELQTAATARVHIAFIDIASRTLKRFKDFLDNNEDK